MSEERLESGLRIAHYSVLERIGAGGMGEVYKALDTRLGRYAAIKLLPPDLTTDEELLFRLIREAKSASALTHPNIITIYDTDRAVIDGTPTWYIAMELIEGETLRERLDRGRVDEITAASVVAQVADALAKAHANGIVHRDLKPENIMITGDGFAKVLDFGLAKLLEATPADGKLTSDGFVVGTISYMSPEQIRGQAVDGRSDIFGLGCVLYELVSSRQAYEAETAAESLHRAIHDEPERLNVAPELRRIIDRCLRKNRDERYQRAKELADDLRRFIRQVEAGGAPPLSIAVLPFRDLTLSDENAHIGLALADAIVTELAASRKLLVRPTTATLAYRGVDPREAGRALGVDSVVDGAFQRSGTRLRVTLQLVSTDGGRSLLSTKIDSSLDELFALQDEVAKRIAKALSIEKPSSGGYTAVGAHNVTEWFMKGKLALSFDTIAKMKEAIDAFTVATATDPDFAPAWAGLADAYARMAFNWDPNGDWHRRAIRAAERALALNPDLPEAHYVRGRLVWSPEEHFDTRTALRHFGAALHMNPNLAEAHSRVGVLMYHVGAMDEAEAELNRTLAINPTDAISCIHLGTCALYRGNPSACLKLINDKIERSSRAFAYYIKAQALLRLNSDEEASGVADLVALLFPEIAYYSPLRALLAARAGNRTRALEQIQRTIEHEKTYGHYHHAQYDIACTYAFLGETELAMQWLRDSAYNGFPCPTFFQRDPFLIAVRGTAFDELIAELNVIREEHRQLYATLIGTTSAA